MKINKSVLAKYIASKTGVTYEKALIIMDGIFSMVKESVAEGNSVEIRGFGTLYPFKSNRTVVRNICKNETMIVPPSVRVKFKAGKDFAKMCKNNN